MHSLNLLASKCIIKLDLLWWPITQFALKQCRWTKQSQIWYYLYFLKRMIEIVTSKCWIYYGTICPPISWKFSSAFYTQNYCLPHGCHAWYQDLLNQNLDCSIHCKNKKFSKIMSMILAIVEDPLNMLVFCWVKIQLDNITCTTNTRKRWVLLCHHSMIGGDSFLTWNYNMSEWIAWEYTDDNPLAETQSQVDTTMG